MRIINASNRKSLSFGMAVNVFAYVLSKCFAIFTSPYITKLLSTSSYGDMSVYNTWTSVVCTIIGLGLASSLVIFKNKSSEEEYLNYCWNAIHIWIIIHILALGISVFAMNIFAKTIDLPTWAFPLMVLNVFGQNVVSFFSGYLLIENEATWNLLMSLFTTIGGFAVAVFVFHNIKYIGDYKYLSFTIGNTVVNLLVGCTIVLYFFRVGHCKINHSYTLYALRIGVPIIFHTLAGIVLASSDRIMIKSISGSSDAGTYSYAYSFATIINNVWSAINAIWSPYYFSLMKNREHDLLNEKRRNFDTVFLCLIIGFIMVFPEIYKLLANHRYWVSMDIVPIVVIAYFFHHLYAFPQGYETFREKTTYIAFGTIGASIINVVLNLLFIPLCGNMGAAMATVISYVALYGFHEMIATRIMKNYPLRNYRNTPFFISSMFIVVLYYSISPYWIARWIIACVDAIVLALLIKRRKAII